MESRLKALKVVELKEILTKAGVTIPAKANKPDLIAKIIETPAALDVFESTRGGGDVVKTAGTPAGGATPQPPPSTTASRLTSEGPAVQNDLLAPPELFDWSSGSGIVDATEKTGTTTTTAKLPSFTNKPVAPPAISTSTPSSEAKPAENKTAADSAATEEEDEEAKKRRLRAARFGIPFVEQKKAQPAAKKQQAQSKAPKAAASQLNKSTAAKPTANGKQFTTTPAVEEDSDRLKKRAERFGMKPSPTPATQSTVGKKRAAPEAEKVDEEELERRRKRAERFGLPVKA